MKLQDFLSKETPIGDSIQAIKRSKESLGIPKWNTLKTQYNPAEHRIIKDPDFWKDKGTKRKPRKVSRITYGMQKLYANRMTQMSMAIPVRRIYTIDKKNKEQESAKKAIEAVYKRVHIDSLNRKRMKAYFASCELLTIWYAVKSASHEDYGFKTEYKLRCKSYSPMDGYDLYPIFDGYDDMLGMCVEYTEKKYEGNGQVEYQHFEIFTPSEHVRFTSDKAGSAWAETLRESIKILKLPLAYIYRTSPIWEDQTNNCDEIELALSRQSEILRHNSAPYLKVAGEMKAAGSNGVAAPTGVPAATPAAKPKEAVNDSDDAVRMVRVENGGDVSYVTWAQSVEAMKFFIEELKRNSDQTVQLPDLSFDNIKSIGIASGEARKTLLTDAHLKVGEESGEIIMFLEREWKVICAFLSFMNPSLKDAISKLSCEHVVIPFIQNDEKADIEKWRLACGEPLLSQKQSIKYSGLVDDEEIEMSAILYEQRERAAIERDSMMFPVAE